MKKITVIGGRPLEGEVSVSGSKNAALPIIFSCILTKGINEIENLPKISDVDVALEILEKMGAKIIREQETTLIDTTELHYVKPSVEEVSAIRASTYLIGSCLGRFAEVDILPFGGCNFSKRPIDMHLYAAKTLGASISKGKIRAESLKGGVVSFDKLSVGATVNAILLAASSEGETLIRRAASEPHIDCLIDFLRSAGAVINRQSDEIYIKKAPLHGGKIKIIGDMIEAGSYLALSALSDFRIRVRNCPIEDMSSIFTAFDSLGINVNVSTDSISLEVRNETCFTKIVCEPYPGFPTDLQPIFATLLAALSGGLIIDNVWQDRFGYLSSLSSFGVKFSKDQSGARIEKTDFHPATVTSPDLRGGFACLLAALCAKGESQIYRAETILRGYFAPCEKLSSLGADVFISEYN